MAPRSAAGGRAAAVSPPQPPVPVSDLVLYVYEHCPSCGLAESALTLMKCQFEKRVLPYDDVETPTGLVGAKMLPILAGTTAAGATRAMPESVDICHHAATLAGQQLSRPSAAGAWVGEWVDRLAEVSAPLCLPRWVRQRRFPEFATDSACAYYNSRKQDGWSDWWQDQIKPTPPLVSGDGGAGAGNAAAAAGDVITTLSSMHAHTPALATKLGPLLEELEQQLLLARGQGIWGEVSVDDLILLSGEWCARC